MSEVFGVTDAMDGYWVQTTLFSGARDVEATNATNLKTYRLLILIKCNRRYIETGIDSKSILILRNMNSL